MSRKRLLMILLAGLPLLGTSASSFCYRTNSIPAPGRTRGMSRNWQRNREGV